ncbi:dehydrodolichyl diphosphate synthase 6-like [Telopea speciosissima]|uniref:dehydrodolichyl diphosphate synthase 6-like n=1 Tax=Telopea speciosissima TaxID=54955 RepID=UPI001CC42F36|nr:dehydrodolichyl diphosphate synthase 6-like [Telopea speciosissima]
MEEGYRAGYKALMSILKYCYELGINCISIYTFSIDNFKRGPNEVKLVMDILQEKLQALLQEKTILCSYSIRILICGDLKLLDEPLRVLAKEVMAITGNNKKLIFCIWVAYTSTNEIVRAVNGSCREKKIMEKDPTDDDDDDDQIMSSSSSSSSNVSVEDIERHLDPVICPEPDFLVRTSGETRLSNLLLWQTTYCYLYSPAVLWPEISLWHMVWAVLNFQRLHPYLENQKKKHKKMEKEE